MSSNNPKCFFCINLQRGILVSITISLLLWTAAILLYIPYVLYYSPAEYIIDGKQFDSLEEYRKYINTTSTKEGKLDESIPNYGGLKVPKNDYGCSKLSIILVMFALFVDSFAIGGIYIKYKVKAEMLIPWLSFYALLIPCLIGAGVANAILQENVTYKYYSMVPVFIAFVYILLWISVFRLYKTGFIKKNVILRGLGDIFLEPITSKVTAYVDECQTEITPSKEA